MGQIPTNNDIPGNSQKSRNVQPVTKNEKPPVPQFNGNVASIKRKKSGTGFWKWMRKMFLSDQKPSDIMKNIVENQIVPGIKDNFRNSMVSSLDMFIYPNSRPASQNNANNSVGYNRMYNNGNNRQQNTQPQQQNQNQGADLNNGFTNPVFKSKMDADQFLVMMKTYDYPTLSVHTLYMMRKQHIDYTWDAYGWTKEEIANVQVTHINNPDWPWMIDLPQAHVIT